MARFLAVTSRGLGEALATELEELGLKVTHRADSSAAFEGNWQGCYRANLCSRIATRVLLPVLDFPAYQPEDIYNNAQKGHDFTKYMQGPDLTFTIDASVSQSKLRDQRLVAMTLKDAIVDQCYEKWDRRPNIDNEKPDLTFFIKVFKNQVSVSVDTSGRSLSQRGYRRSRTEAPLREHLAAALLKMTGWTPGIPLMDLMCGSGTFLIEAALVAKNVYPGTFQKSFAFQKFPGFQEDVFGELIDEISVQEKEDLGDYKFYGFDISGQALKASEENAKRADVMDCLELKRVPVDMLKNPCPPEQKGVIVINPPYGERLGSKETVKDVYRDLAYTLKREFKGWTMWLLSGDSELTSALHLKSTQKYPVYNGPIECRWLKYELR